MDSTTSPFGTGCRQDRRTQPCLDANRHDLFEFVAMTARRRDDCLDGGYIAKPDEAAGARWAGIVGD